MNSKRQILFEMDIRKQFYSPEGVARRKRPCTCKECLDEIKNALISVHNKHVFIVISGEKTSNPLAYTIGFYELYRCPELVFFDDSIGKGEHGLMRKIFTYIVREIEKSVKSKALTSSDFEKSAIPLFLNPKEPETPFFVGVYRFGRSEEDDTHHYLSRGIHQYYRCRDMIDYECVQIFIPLRKRSIGYPGADDTATGLLTDPFLLSYPWYVDFLSNTYQDEFFPCDFDFLKILDPYDSKEYLSYKKRMLNKCSLLGCENKKNFYCAGCLSAQYCSKKCSKIDWKRCHGKVCELYIKHYEYCLMSKEEKEIFRGKTN